MQGSHTHIPGTNHVPKGYIVAAILSLLFMVPLCLVPALALLFFYVIMIIIVVFWSDSSSIMPSVKIYIFILICASLLCL